MRKTNADDSRGHRPPIGLEEGRHPDDDLGREGKGDTRRLEHVLEDRDDEDEEDDHGHAGHRENHGRVDHGALDLPDQGVVFLQEGGQTKKDGVQDTPGLTGGHHVHVELGEDLRVLPHGVGQGVPRLDVVENILDHLPKSLVFGLLGQDVEALDQRAARS